MKSKKKNTVIFKIIFVLIGFISLVKIIKDYGFHIIVDEINRIGFWLALMGLTFIPTLICYSISWLLITEHQRIFAKISFFQKVAIFTKFTIISIAWNNLTPFLKIGGEPLKYMMLSKHMPQREALASTINYNIIHMLATGFSFVITSVLVVIFYNISNELRFYLLGFAVFISLLFYLGFLIMRVKFVYVDKIYRYRAVKIVIVNVKLAFRRLLKFYKKNPGVFFLSLFFDIIARFVEGLTFYLGFYFIKHPITFLTSSLLDVGRAFVDIIFFFIPYQIGSREEGVHFFMEKILLVNSKGFLTAVFFYRFVEIAWILIGYVLWVSSKSSSKEEKT